MSRSGRRRTGTSDARHRLLDMMGVQAPDEDLISVGISLQWAHVRPLRGRLVLGGLLALVVGLTTLALPELVGRTLDATVAGEVTWHLWATVTVIVVSVVTSLFDPPLLASVQAGGAMSLTRDLVRHCLRLGIPGRRPFEHGDLLNRAAGDVPAAVRYTTTRLELTVQAMIAVGSAIGLALVHWSFLLVLVAGVLVLTSLARRVLARFGDLIAEYRRNVGDLAGRYVDAERGRRTIAASGTLDREVVRVTRPLDELAESGRRLIAMQGRLGAQISALFDLSTVVLVALGGWLLTRSAITPGGIITALAYARFSMGSVIDLFDRGAFQLTASRVSAGRVAEVMRTPVATPPATDPAPPRLTPAASVRFEAVTVAGDEQPILDRLDLTVPAGATVALVGRSGAGKSTIAALVGRLLDPDRGTVRIDGVDVRSLDLDVLGGLVTYAFEQPTLLGETLHDTIAYGTTASPDEVAVAGATVAAAPFIERMPLGYDTPLDDAPLSGGERQRLGLARAALQRTPILVLDDATSSLDTATEAQVHASLAELARGKTTIIVAHRASTAARADLVAWLADGRIRAVAPHLELWGDAGYQAVFRGPVGATTGGNGQPAGPPEVAP